MLVLIPADDSTLLQWIGCVHLATRSRVLFLAAPWHGGYHHVMLLLKWLPGLSSYTGGGSLSSGVGLLSLIRAQWSPTYPSQSPKQHKRTSKHPFSFLNSLETYTFCNLSNTSPVTWPKQQSINPAQRRSITLAISQNLSLDGPLAY